MKRLFASLAAASLLFVSSLVAASPRDRDAERGEKTHVVAPGQTLAKIAKRYRVSIQELREVNELPAGSLKPGTRLIIPTDSPPAKKDSDDRSHGARAKSGKDTKASKRGQDSDDRDEEDDEENPRKGKGKKHKKAQAEQDDDSPSTVETGHVHLVHGDKSWEGKVLQGKSKVSPAANKAFQRLLAPEKGKSHAIDRRLISLLVKVSDHFGGRPIEVVSGFRPGKGGSHSKHNSGSAIDFHIPGVRNEELRDFVRGFEKVGVGYYPNSGFVHLDVRPASFSWTDTSKPGESAKYTHEEPSEGDADADADEGKSKGSGKKKSKDSKKKDPR